MTTSVIAVDVHEDADLTQSEVDAINQAVARAKENDEFLFYMLPEGTILDSRIEEKTVSSILRYDPKRENPYRQARIDEQISNRGGTNTQFVGKEKAQELANKEEKHGRPSFAGPPDSSNAPPWAGPPSHASPPENGGGPPENGGGPPENGGGPPENGGGPPENGKGN